MQVVVWPALQCIIILQTGSVALRCDVRSKPKPQLSSLIHVSHIFSTARLLTNIAWHPHLLYFPTGHFCFFLQHSSGHCVRSAVKPYVSTARLNIWYLELTSQCTYADSQFRFLNEGVLNHVSSTGCVLPIDGKNSPRDGTRLVVLNGNIHCGNKTGQAYTMTSQGALRHSSGKCIQPQMSFQTTPAIGAKLEYTSKCNTTKQRFIFGT